MKDPESLARDALRLMDEGKLDQWEQTMEPDCEFTAPGVSIRGRTAVQGVVEGFRRAFPDVRHTPRVAPASVRLQKGFLLFVSGFTGRPDRLVGGWL